jgi:hypothetical protein
MSAPNDTYGSTLEPQAYPRLSEPCRLAQHFQCSGEGIDSRLQHHIPPPPATVRTCEACGLIVPITQICPCGAGATDLALVRWLCTCACHVRLGVRF